LIGKNDSGHEITIDTRKELGGHDSAPSPMEMLLFSLGGCTLMDVISLIDKMRVDYSDIEVKVSGERRDEHPKIFKSIKIKFIVYGNNPDESKIKKAINLSSKKYCSVHAMLEKSVPIEGSLEIIRGRKAEAK
ncbi:MAG: OsmC family protein, partial [candidate division WOR-3 bacterium]